MRNAFITVLISTILFVVFVNSPAHWFSLRQNLNLGTTLTTISSASQLSNFPTTYNANLTAINNGKFELSDWFATTSAVQITTLNGLTTATALATFGTAAATTTSSGGLKIDNLGLQVDTLTAANCDLKADSNGSLYCGAELTGGLFAWDVANSIGGVSTSTILGFFNGFVSTASSTALRFSMTAATTTNATSTGTHAFSGDIKFPNQTASGTAPMVDSSGLVTFNSAMRLLGRTELGSAGGSISVTGDFGTSTPFLQVRFYVVSTEDANPNNILTFRFNNNSGALYNYSYMRDNGAVTESLGATGIDFAANNATNYRWGTMNIQNNPNTFKLIDINGTEWDNSTNFVQVDERATYNASTTEAIVRVDAVSTGVAENFSSGSWVEVWGF